MDVSKMVRLQHTTRLGVQQCQAQGLAGLIQDRIRMCNIKGVFLTGVGSDFDFGPCDSEIGLASLYR